ncbi:MAG TPA: DUF2071 domain-containing protein, partial [Clostridia bacterium]|nr:DUF2071 domain-containing protein [Clostridia bacterium]
FHVSNMRPVGLPPLPGMREFEEINVRTYVRHGDVPGIWFFSLDASKLVPSVAARYTYGLPYYKAQIDFSTTQSWHAFSHKRTGPPAAEFGASWRAGQRLRAPDKESLAFFLVERYCAFAVQRDQVQQIRIYHHPWILSEAMVNLHSSSLIAALGLAEPVSEPLAHFTEPMDVEIWPPAEAQSMGEPRSRRIAVRAS